MLSIRARLIALLLVATSALVQPSAAQPAAPTTPAPIHDHSSHSPASGLQEIVLPDGHRLLTHGGEPRTAEWMDPPVGDHGGQGWPHDERQPVCATDHYQHFLYTLPGVSAVEALGLLDRAKPSIRTAVRQMNAVLNNEAIASGGKGADFKVKCDEKGDIAVDNFISVGPDFYAITTSARFAGFNDPNVDYTIFVGVPWIYCGQGSFSEDDSPGVGNKNNNGGGYAIVWEGCWFGRTPMHENGHNQGAVLAGAPNSTGAAHCNDQRDVMCYSDLGPTDKGDFVACADRIHYDCGHDSYFDAAPEPGEWLTSHWNIGDPANRFIKFVGHDYSKKAADEDEDALEESGRAPTTRPGFPKRRRR